MKAEKKREYNSREYNLRRCGLEVITTAPFLLSKSELKLWACSNLARGESQICDGETKPCLILALGDFRVGEKEHSLTLKFFIQRPKVIEIKPLENFAK